MTTSPLAFPTQMLCASQSNTGKYIAPAEIVALRVARKLTRTDGSAPNRRRRLGAIRSHPHRSSDRYSLHKKAPNAIVPPSMDTVKCAAVPGGMPKECRICSIQAKPPKPNSNPRPEASISVSAG